MIKERTTERTTASLQFKVEPQTIPWIYASLMNQIEVSLYEGEFPEPFTSLQYVLHNKNNQILLTAALGLGEEFNSRYGNTVGNPEDLAPFFHRYPQCQTSPQGDTLFIYKNDQIQGAISRISEDKIIIQQGGPFGQISLDANTPTNSLAIALDHFNLLVGRYTGTIWRASEETNQKQLNMVLNLPYAPEGAANTYFSTFEVVGRQYREIPRKVDLDEEIGGYKRAKEEMRALFMDLTNPDQSRSFGTQPFSNKFILFTGDEGTGKSLLPKALFTQLRNHLFSEDPNHKMPLEYYRLNLRDMFTQTRGHTATVVNTVIEHVKENDRQKIPTILHIDNLEYLIPPEQQSVIRALKNGDPFIQPTTQEQYGYYMQVVNPVIVVLHKLGQELGAESHHVVVYGESRVPRKDLPENVARIFRRAFHLQPTEEDLADILRVQIKTTRGFATRSGADPFSADIDSYLKEIAAHAANLVGTHIKQAIVNISNRKKAEWDGTTYRPITPKELVDEFDEMRTERGIFTKPKPPLGFQPQSRIN